MHLPTMQTVSRYSAKLLRRNWLFRVFILLSLVVIVVYHLTSQSKLIWQFSSGPNHPTSYIAYINVWLFNFFQVFPLIFLAGAFLGKDKKLDTMDVVLAHPMSNAEYIWGMCRGIVRTFMGMGLIALCLGMAVNLFFSGAPFHAGVYLFYWITLLLPSQVFLLGFSFLLLSYIPNRALNILLMMGIVGVIVVYLGEIQSGVFDPLGLTLPNVFSDITGHTHLSGYLMQRGAWFFIGLSLIGFSVMRFKRLPNAPNKRTRYLVTAVVLLAGGLFFGANAYTAYRSVLADRAVYSQVYDRYEPQHKLSLLRASIAYAQEGAQMQVTARLTVRNDHSRTLEEGLFYLNPGLEVVRLTEGGQSLPWERDHQVVRIRRTFAPEETCMLEIEYRGGIDPGVCYLDVPDEVYMDTRQPADENCRFGKHSSFLQSGYTLLIPECLWYPVTVPPVNPQSSFAIRTPFVEFELTVKTAPGQAAISQGASVREGETVRFTPEHPIKGLSLCMGDYRSYAVTDSDGIEYELYLHRKHGFLIDSLEYLRDTLPELLAAVRYAKEADLGQAYPFERLRIVEAPITFYSYYRNERGKSEQVQPEMCFLPERAIGMYNALIKEAVTSQKETARLSANFHADSGMEDMSEQGMAINALKGFISNQLFAEYGGYAGNSNRFAFLGVQLGLRRWSSMFDYYRNANPYNITPLFVSEAASLSSDTYPFINTMLSSLLLGSNDQKKADPYSFVNINNRGPIDYFSAHSLKEALNDRTLNARQQYSMLRCKMESLLQLLALEGVPMADFNVFIRDFLTAGRFSESSFSHFEAAFSEHFDVDLGVIMNRWYHQNRLPRYLIKDMKSELVSTSPDGTASFMESSSRISLKIINTGEIDGVVTLSYVTLSSDRAAVIYDEHKQVETHYLIRAGEGKEIALLTKGPTLLNILNTYLSLNNPSARNTIFRGMVKTTDTTTYEKLLSPADWQPDAGVVIVDNEDPGFLVTEKNTGSRLRQWLSDSDAAPENTNNVMVPGERWQKHIHGELWGDYTLSAMYKAAGKGDATLSWTADIQQPGEYEIFIFSPSASAIVTTSRSMRGGRGGVFSFQVGGGGSPTRQYYRIAGEPEEVALDVQPTGDWISLGHYTLDAGPHTVTLTDKGEPEQTIIGDAVKWVRIGE